MEALGTLVKGEFAAGFGQAAGGLLILNLTLNLDPIRPASTEKIKD
jgi:hypothetical protein